MKRITIKEIAKKAGVSAGTVDRVLHNRGKVKPEVEKEVRRIMKDVGYKVNILASGLAMQKKKNIATILPDPNIDPYWKLPDQGIDFAAEELLNFGIKIKKYHFDLFDEESFPLICEKVLEQEVEGILLAPIFATEAKSFLQKCKEKGLPVTLINAFIDFDDYAISYIGQDSYHSGVLGARLLGLIVDKTACVMVLNLGEKARNTSHLLEKERGFKDYFSKLQSEIKVHTADFSKFDQPDALKAFLISIFEKYPNLQGIYVTTSRAYKVVSVLPENLLNKVKIIGFDLLEQNVEYLNSGKISFLINQHPAKQGYKGVMSLFRYLVLKEDVEKMQYLPLDIVVKENYHFYLSNRDKYRMYF